MEYGCELWNSCGFTLSESLEKLHMEAARIVTGLPSLYILRQGGRT